MPSGAQCAPVCPLIRSPVSPCPKCPPTPFPCAKCTQTFEFSEPSQVTETQSEKEKEMETVTAISMRRGGAWGSGWTVTQITNWIRSVSCLSLSLSLSGSNLPCSHNLVALSSLTLLCSAHYQAALCCPIARVWTSTQTDRERGRGGDCRTHTDLYLVHNLAKQLALSFRRGSFVPALK